MNDLRLALDLPLAPNRVDMRDAFFGALNKIAERNPSVLLLTDDQGAFAIDWMRDNLPKQYLNIGIAEQNLVSVAAGLALGGKIPFIYGIATFMTMRCYEQVRDDVCCERLPVSIVASGGGYTYGYDGPTHHATQDVAILRTLPDMTILSPSDASSTSQFARMAVHEPGPKYIRLEKGTVGRIYPDDFDFSAGFEILIDGTDLLIASTGLMVHQALEVSQRLRALGVNAGVLDMYRLKPVDSAALLAVVGQYPRVVTLEEHSIIGGLGSIIAEILVDAGQPQLVKRFALPDSFTYSYGSREWLQERDGLGIDEIVRRARTWLSGH